uniref:Oxidoreductase-like domain-containing protein n=1 Tax=Palpitomonas bilix TaxID=652834 RepID=A0A7S3DL86_9EUKA
MGEKSGEGQIEAAIAVWLAECDRYEREEVGKESGGRQAELVDASSLLSEVELSAGRYEGGVSGGGKEEGRRGSIEAGKQAAAKVEGGRKERKERKEMSDEDVASIWASVALPSHIEVRQDKGKKKRTPPPKPEPPEEPFPDDCCGSGCTRCVWDVYYDELEQYEAKLEEYTQLCEKMGVQQ